MEDGVVASINGVTAIYIGNYSIPDLLWTALFVSIELLEVCLLVGTCVSAQDCLVVDIIGISPAATGMIRWKAEDIEILCCSDYGILFDVISKDGSGELAFDKLAGDGQRMILVEVESSSDM